MSVTGTAGIALLVARVVFGGVLAYMGAGHFTDLEGKTGYAEHKSLPAPRLAVVGSGLVLVLGGLGIVFGVYPVVSAIVLAVFLLVSGISMHGPEEGSHFRKNLVMTGGALAFAAIGMQAWSYSAGIGLW